MDPHIKKTYFRVARFFIAAICITGVTAAFDNLNAKETVQQDSLDFTANELIIQLSKRPRAAFSNHEIITQINQKSIDSLNAIYGAKAIIPLVPNLTKNSYDENYSEISNTFLIRFQDDQNISELIKAYESLKVVVSAHPNYLYYSKNKKGINSALLDKIQLEEAISEINPQKSILIGLIDTGIEPRFRNSPLIWNNPLEKIDGKDNDQNGFIDDVFGVNFWDLNHYQNPVDTDGHGTSIYLIIEQLLNTFPDHSEKIHQNQLIILKAGDAEQDGKIVFSSFSLAQSILYAVDHGANIVNLTCAGKYPSETLESCINYANDNNCTLIAAAGEHNTNQQIYPAAYENVISVTACDFEDHKYRQANYGSWVDISAPGWLPQYHASTDTITAEASETAVAAAYVSGIASMLLANEEQIDSDSLKKRLLFSSENIYHQNLQFSGKLGAGRLNALRLFNNQQLPNIVVQNILLLNDNQLSDIHAGDRVSVQVELKNLSSRAKNVQLKIASDDPYLKLLHTETFIPNLEYDENYSNEIDPFRLRISPEMPADHQSKITLIVEANKNFSVSEELSIPIGLIPPKNIAIENRNPITVSWHPSGQFKGYFVYRSSDAEKSFIQLNPLLLDTPEFRDVDIRTSSEVSYYVTGVDSNGIESAPSDTISITLFSLPSFEFFPVNDTLTVQDSVRLFAKTSDSSLSDFAFQWQLNGMSMLEETTSIFIFKKHLTNNSVDTVQLNISIPDQDTLLTHRWFLFTDRKKDQPEIQIESAFPKADTTISSGDSLTFYLTIGNHGSEISYQWHLNQVQLSDQEDSVYVYKSDSVTFVEDTVRCVASTHDTTVSFEWKIKIITPNIADLNIADFTFSPQGDTTINDRDSLIFSIKSEFENLHYRWLINDTTDTNFTGNNFILKSPQIKNDTTQVTAFIISGDTLKKEWIITYLPDTNLVQALSFSFLNDTTIFEGDTLKFAVKTPVNADSTDEISWAVNSVVDSTARDTVFFFKPDYFSAGVDTISFHCDYLDSLYQKQWIVNVLNRNRAPIIESSNVPSDTTLTYEDSLLFSIQADDADLDTLKFQWIVNQIPDTTATDTFYYFHQKSDNSGSTDMLQVQIADADTAVYLRWFIQRIDSTNHPPQILSATPALDSVVTKTDSIRFQVKCVDPDGDSLSYQWLINSVLDTTAFDNTFLFTKSDSVFSVDTLTVNISDRDTTVSAQWILAEPGDTIQTQPDSVKFFPETDSLFASEDSLIFRIENKPDSATIQWFVNSKADSLNSDSVFVFIPQTRQGQTDTIKAYCALADTNFFHYWFVHYPQDSTHSDSLKIIYEPEDKLVFCPQDDSVKFSIRVPEKPNFELTFSWFINSEIIENARDTTYFFKSINAVPRIDTLTALISSPDTAYFFNWFVKVQPPPLLAPPKPVYPIRGTHVSEFESLMWENDSSLADTIATAEFQYIVQLSPDSSFSSLLSEDSVRTPYLSFQELNEFDKLTIGQLIFWRVKVIDSTYFSSAFSSPSEMFYYYPAFSIVDDFRGERNENSINLYWSTSYNKYCQGFNLFRSMGDDGDFKKINAEIITGSESFSFIDRIEQTGVNYYYKLEEITTEGRNKFHRQITVEIPKPNSYLLSQNFPNPFNSETSFKYQIPDPSHVKIEVYNLLGKKVKTLVNERKDAGFYHVFWDGIDDNGKNVVSGVYFYHMVADRFHATHKMIVVR